MSEVAECCICLQPLFSSSLSQRSSEENDVGALVCGHVFHYVCAMQQLEHRRQCPMCRANFEKKSISEVLFVVRGAPPRPPKDNDDDGVVAVDGDSRDPVVDHYMASLNEAYCDVKRKVEVLSSRASSLASREAEMSERIRTLTEERNQALCIESALRGKWEQELTARAEAEELAMLRQCVMTNKRMLSEAQQSHAVMLRELSDVTESINWTRQRMSSIQRPTNHTKRPRAETAV